MRNPDLPELPIRGLRDGRGDEKGAMGVGVSVGISAMSPAEKPRDGVFDRTFQSMTAPAAPPRWMGAEADPRGRHALPVPYGRNEATISAMGEFSSVLGDRAVVLRARTKVGRGPENDLVIDHEHVSSFHALVEWSPEGCWTVRDLGSTNGTFVDDAQLSPGEQRTLSSQTRVAFGDPSEVWSLADDSRPPAEAVDVASGERRLAEHEMLVIGRGEGQAVVMEERPGVWVIELGGRSQPARDAQELRVGGRSWKLSLPVGLPRTARTTLGANQGPAPALGGAQLRFVVSKDLEHITMTVASEGQEWTTDRAYLRVLVELARLRLAESDRVDLPMAEQGWVYSDELCRLAGLDDEARLNVEIHRARKDMGKHGVACPASIVERRRGTKQLRFGPDAVEIIDHAAPSSDDSP